MPKKTILVLEDEKERIEWLRENIKAPKEICWTTNVKDFLENKEKLEKSGELTLIILDNKLKSPLDGSGMEAVTHMESCDVPVMIWSNSLFTSKDMWQELTNKGIKAWCRSFDYDMSTHAIDRILSGKKL